VHEVDLPTAVHLAQDRLADQRLVPLGHKGAHRQTVLRRRVDNAHITDATERHVERPRDRRGREGEHVDLAPHLLQLLLVADAKALFLVDDEQP